MVEPKLSPFGGTGRELHHLGNITQQVNTSNVVVAEFNFDAWGRRRNPADWGYTITSEPALFADRGFTGHEYLSYFNLYNMNGRLYDPLVGRFLSADPYVQNGGLTQSYNRYSYCLNNPLRYTDPSGYKWHWKWLNPLYWFSEGMQLINDNTNGLRKKMADVGVPDFSVGGTVNLEGNVNVNGSINGHEVFNTANIDRSNAKQVVSKEIAQVRKDYGPAWHAAGQGFQATLGNSQATWDLISLTIGVLGTSSDIARESGYVTTIGTNLMPYASGWSGNQYVKTIGIAKGASTVFFLAGGASDVYMYSQGYQSGAKTLTNLGVNGTAMYLGGVPGIILGGGYLLIDKTVGWDRMMTPSSNDQWVPNRASFPDGTTIYVCFKAGTQILTKGGLRPIEQIIVGDSVYSYNLEKNIVELGKVVKSFERKTQEIYELTTDNQKIFVTAEHPFYVEGKGWVKVKNLESGTVLRTKEGSIEHVTSSVLDKHPETVYNIEVEGNHNYFVTNSNILVHNK